MGFLRLCKYCSFATIGLIVILLFVPGIPPHLAFTSYKIDPSLPRQGPLAKNNILDDAERLFENYLISPESIASRASDELFVSLHNGNIVRVWGQDFDQTEVVANLGPGCAGPWEEHICGRPLGLRFSKTKKLLIADAYLGIFALDLKTGKSEKLVDPKIPIAGAKPLLIDDLDEDDSGNIYWSDASSISNLANSLLEGTAQPSGRLVKYNPETKTNEVLIPDIRFANGVQLSPDQQFVLVSETFRHRVLRYWLKGPKAGSSDVFISGLPGMPDNIRARKEGGYYVSLVAPRHPNVTDVGEILSRSVQAKKVLTRATFLVQWTLDFLNSYFPNHFCASLSYKLFHLGVAADMVDYGEAIVAEVSESGKLTSSLQGSKGVLKMVSETQQVGDFLFFGSPYANYLGRIHVSKTGKKPSAKKDAQEQPQKEQGGKPPKNEEL